MTARQDGPATALLRRCGTQPDDAIGLADAALALAALARPPGDRRRVPEADCLARYRDHLAALCREAAEYAAQSPPVDLAQRAGILAHVLAERHGYAGDEDTYDDLDNADLMRVIDRRRGLPVSLGILYLHVARAQGWGADGLGFPGHFLIRLQDAGERLILDPFNAAAQRSPAELRDMLKAMAGSDAELRPEHYAPVGNREILLRLQNNIKLRHLRRERLEAALEVLERMLLFAPDETALWSEAGALCVRLGQLRGARAHFERYLRLEDDPAGRSYARATLDRIADHLN